MLAITPRLQSLVAALAAFSALACASVPAAEDPIDWQAASRHWSVHIVTLDADGEERVTRVWIALYQGIGAIRTNHTRWLANLRRDPDLHLRVDGVDHPMRVEFVDEAASTEVIDRAFLEKYGWQERLLMGEQGREPHAFFLLLVPRSQAAPSAAGAYPATAFGDSDSRKSLRQSDTRRFSEVLTQLARSGRDLDFAWSGVSAAAKRSTSTCSPGRCRLRPSSR